MDPLQAARPRLEITPEVHQTLRRIGEPILSRPEFELARDNPEHLIDSLHREIPRLYEARRHLHDRLGEGPNPDLSQRLANVDLLLDSTRSTVMGDPALRRRLGSAFPERNVDNKDASAPSANPGTPNPGAPSSHSGGWGSLIVPAP